MRKSGQTRNGSKIKKIMEHLDPWLVEYPGIKKGDCSWPINFQLNLELLAKNDFLMFLF
jgi:hypothetical protein